MEPTPAYNDGNNAGEQPTSSNGRSVALVALVLVFGILVALAPLLLYKCIKLCLNRVATSPWATKRTQQYAVVPDDVMRRTSIEGFLQKMQEEQHIRFTPEQLAGFTRDYSAQLGRGGYGTVYKGTLPNGLAVAVKVLHGDRKTSDEQFMAEMNAIGRTHHINLVRLYGFCFDDVTATHALVYEFMEHGALGDYLSVRGAGVSMATVLDIATGVARGLGYLHEECQRKIVHHDIKPGNVLLDGSLTPKLADFGLARLLNRADTHASLSVFGGTPGYIAPELWKESRFTEKCDVYSFGILMFDIIRRGRKLEGMDAAPDSESGQPWFPMMAWTRYEAGELMELACGANGGPPWRGRAAAVQRAGEEDVQGGILVRTGMPTSKAVHECSGEDARGRDEHRSATIPLPAASLCTGEPADGNGEQPRHRVVCNN